SERILSARGRVVLGQLATVRAANERFLTRPGQHDPSHTAIIPNVMKRRTPLFPAGHIQRIEPLWPVDGDVGDGVFLFEEDVGEGHKFKITGDDCVADSMASSSA